MAASGVNAAYILLCACAVLGGEFGRRQGVVSTLRDEGEGGAVGEEPRLEEYPAPRRSARVPEWVQLPSPTLSNLLDEGHKRHFLNSCTHTFRCKNNKSSTSI